VEKKDRLGSVIRVDDSEGVRMEGDEYGFRIVVVRQDDEHWTERVLDAVAELDKASAVPIGRE